MNTTQASTVGRHLAKNSRPQNIVYSGLLAALTAFCMGTSFSIALFCYIEILFLYALAAGYNNLHDRETDRLNKRTDNPLLQGLLSNLTLKIFFASCLVVLGVLQFFLKQPATLLITLIYIGLNAAYSHPKLNVKARGLFATMLLGFCYGTLPFLLGALQVSTVAHIYPTALFELLIVVPIILAKDYKDLIGDRQTKKLTPLLIYGSKTVAKLALGIGIMAVIIYFLLARQQSVPLFVVLVATAFYLGGIYYLHKTKGAMNTLARKLLMLTILGMTTVLLT